MGRLSLIKFIPYLVLSVFSFFLVLIWFSDDYVLGSAESGLPFFDIGRVSDITSYSWTNSNLGFSWSINIAGKPTYWLLSRLQILGVPGFIIEAFFFWILWATAGVSIFFLTKELFSKIKDRYALLSVFFYWFNPISLVNVWNRFLYNYMVFWAFLPLALLLFIKGLKEEDLRFAILTSLSSVIYSFALTSVPFNLILWFLFFYTTCFFVFLKKTSLRFGISFFLLTFFTFSLFNFWWISQAFSFLFSTSYTTAVGEFFSEGGNLATLSILSQKLGNFVDTTRLMHATFFRESGFFWARIYYFFLSRILEFFFLGLIFWAILKFRKNFSVLYFGSLFLLSLFLVKGNNPPFGEIFEWFFVKFTFLQVFRNPFEKFGFLLALSATPLFSFGVDKLTEAIRSEKLGKFFVGFSFFFVLAFLGFPFWTGLIFTYKDEASGKLRTYEVKVPDYYKEANEWFKKQGDNFRFISLPLGGEGMTYTWDKPYSGVELSSILFETPNISFNTTIPYYTDYVSEIDKRQLDESLFNFLPFLNTKFILLRKDIDFRERSLANPETVLKRIKKWQEEGLIEKAAEFGELIIYKLNDKFFLPKIYLTTQVLFSNRLDFDFKNAIDKEGKTALLYHTDFDKIDESERGFLVVGPSETEFRPDFIEDLVRIESFTPEESLGLIFYAKHLPDSKLYPLVRIKEKIDVFMRRKRDDKEAYRSLLLGKRAYEVYRVYKERNDLYLAKKSEDGFIKYLNEVKDDLKSSFVSNKTVRESIFAQLKILCELNSPLCERLEGFLKENHFLPKFLLSSHADDFSYYLFNIPRSGVYLLKIGSSSGDAVQKVYLNGNEINLPDLGSGVYLDKGYHELALKTDYKNLVRRDVFVVDNEDFERFDFLLPNVKTPLKISFDYKFDYGRNFEVFFREDINVQNSPLYYKLFEKDPIRHEFLNFSLSITPHNGASAGSLELRIPETKECKRDFPFIKLVCTQKEMPTRVEFRNFNLAFQPNHLPYFASSEEVDAKGDYGSIENFKKLSPVEYKLELQKGEGKEILVFSELFNSGWKVVFDDGTVIPEDKHILVNGYANGWIIDKPGSYELTIKFAPQDLLEKGEKISVGSVLGGALLLGFLSLKKRK